MMKNYLYATLTILSLVWPLGVLAQPGAASDSLPVTLTLGSPATGDSLIPTDTLCLYNSWESMLDRKPFLVLQGPIAFENNPCEYIFYTGNGDLQVAIEKYTLAIILGDSTWLLNSQYLLNNFKCDYTGFNNFIPVYFSSKMAFVRYWDGYPYASELQQITAPDGEDVLLQVDLPNGHPVIYLIDFDNLEVNQLNHNTLEKRLMPYHDLYTRYMGMKKRKKDDIVSFFFQKYLDRVAGKPDAPDANFFP